MIRAPIPSLGVLSLSLAAALFAAPATGADLTINFTGRFIEPTCTMTLKDIDLGEAKVDQFTGSYTGPWVDVPIKVTGCSELTTLAVVTFSGTADPDRSDVYAGMTGVGVDLRVKSTETPLGPGSAPVNLDVATGGGTYAFIARMIQTAGGVKPGAFSTPVTVTVAYQ